MSTQFADALYNKLENEKFRHKFFKQFSKLGGDLHATAEQFPDFTKYHRMYVTEQLLRANFRALVLCLVAIGIFAGIAL